MRRFSVRFHYKHILKLLFLFISTKWISVSHAYEIQVQCGDDGKLISRQVKSPLDPLQNLRLGQDFELIKRINSSSNTCLRSQYDPTLAQSSKGDEIQLYSLANSRARNFSSRSQLPSSWFDKSVISEIASAAIKNKIDPYVALAIVAIEQRQVFAGEHPISSSSIRATLHNSTALDQLNCRTRSVSIDDLNRNGLTPIDVHSIGEYLKKQDSCDSIEDDLQNKRCIRKIVEPQILRGLPEERREKIEHISNCYTNKKCKLVDGMKGPMVNVDLTPPLTSSLSKPKTAITACTDGPVSLRSISLLSGSSLPEKKCCFQITINSSQSNYVTKNGFNSHIVKQLKAELTLRFIRSQLNQNAKLAKGVTGERKISLILQQYNGLGRMPQRIGSCLGGLNMAERPVYGATVADVAYHLFMNNQEINSMLEALYSQSGEKKYDFICATLGPGKHKIDSMNFVRQQSEFLRGDSSSPERRLACTKGKPPVTFESWTSNDAKDFFFAR